MAPMMDQVAHLANVLATPEQLIKTQSDDLPEDLIKSLLFAGARLTQMAGTLLRLPQDVVAQSIVLFTRFWVGEDGGDLREYGVRDISAACIYLASKLSAHQKSWRSVINVYTYLAAVDDPTTATATTYAELSNPEAYFVTEGQLETQRLKLNQLELIILQTLGFETNVALPHTLCINYLQTLGTFIDGSGPVLAKRAFAHLNDALLSPQMLYLTHQPNALATAAIYLAARELGVKLPGTEWWEVFDVDREELGFLVVAHISFQGFVEEERRIWDGRKILLTVQDLETHLANQLKEQI